MTNYANDASAGGCYIFTEGSGTALNDQTANNNDGTFGASGHPAWSSTVPSGYSNYSANYDGSSNDYIKTTANASIEFQCPLSLTAWVKHTDHTAERTIWGGDDGSSFVYFAINTAGKLKVDKRNALAIGTSNTAVLSGVYVHVAFTQDALGAFIFYQNGVADGTGTNLPLYTYNLNPLGLGATISGGVGVNAMLGLLTEIGGFSRVLSSTEINDIKDHGLTGYAGASVSSVRLERKNPRGYMRGILRGVL